MLAPTQKPLYRFVILAAALVLIVGGLEQAQSVLASFLVSVFFAVLAAQPVFWLERHRVPVLLAVLLVVLGMVIILLGAGVIIGSSLTDFYAGMPEYQARIQEHVVAFKAYLASKNLGLPDDILQGYLNPGAVMNLTAGLFMGLGSVISDIVLIVLTVSFILLEATSFPIKLRAVLGNPRQAFPQFTRFVNDMKRYMVIKTLISLGTGVLIATWLTVMGVDFPILWGFLAFLLNYVPSIGSTVAGIPAVLLALVQLGVWRALVVAAGYMCVNFVLDYGIETRLMGRKLGLSTLVVFLSLIVWGSLLGPVGAVLCIPLTMTLKFAFESNQETRWIAVLLGPEDLAEGLPPESKKPTRQS